MTDSRPAPQPEPFTPDYTMADLDAAAVATLRDAALDMPGNWSSQRHRRRLLEAAEDALAITPAHDSPRDGGLRAAILRFASERRLQWSDDDIDDLATRLGSAIPAPDTGAKFTAPVRKDRLPTHRGNPLGPAPDTGAEERLRAALDVEPLAEAMHTRSRCGVGAVEGPHVVIDCPNVAVYRREAAGLADEYARLSGGSVDEEEGNDDDGR